MIYVAGFFGLLIVAVTLVTYWALSLARDVREPEPELGSEEGEPEETEELEADPALKGIRHVDEMWDEIVFEGVRYRKCLRYGSDLYSSASLGWLKYPEGTPVTGGARHCLDLDREYGRRKADDQASAAARAAREAWGKEERLD